MTEKDYPYKAQVPKHEAVLHLKTKLKWLSSLKKFPLFCPFRNLNVSTGQSWLLLL